MRRNTGPHTGAREPLPPTAGPGRLPLAHPSGARSSWQGAAYSTALALGLSLAAPWWLWRMATTARYREGLLERLGRIPARMRPAIGSRKMVWVHAVSVGEVLAVAQLVAELESALRHELPGDPAPRVVVSTTTRTGQALARGRFGAENVFYLPLDFAFAVRSWLRALQPALVVLAESELWPRLLAECNRRGIPVAVVNARVSDRSLRRGLRVRSLWRGVLRRVTLFLAQSEADAVRLRRLGAPPDRVQVSGNLKFDLRLPRPGRLTGLLGTLAARRPVVVAGSTVEGEEALVLEAFRAVWAAMPEALLVLAPRHPERFEAVFQIASRFSTPPSGHAQSSACQPSAPQTSTTQSDVQRASALLLQDSAPGPGVPPPRVVVLDTIGDLAAVYGLAHVAFVGGSLVPRGGHNPLEPARWGVPVVTGPSLENFRAVAAALQSAGGLRIVKNVQDFAQALLALLTNSEAAHTLGERAHAVFEVEGGATARSIQRLMPLILLADHTHPHRHDPATGEGARS